MTWYSPVKQPGPEVVRYGPFRVREVLYTYPDGGRERLGEINVTIDHSPADSGNDVVQLVFPISLRRTDLAYVLRHIRIWVNNRRVLIDAIKTSLHDVEAALQALALDEGLSENAAPTRHDETLPQLQKAEELRADAEGLRAEKDVMEPEFELVDKARLELEAQHPELDLGPIEETITPDPEYEEALMQALRKEHGESEDSVGEDS